MTTKSSLPSTGGAEQAARDAKDSTTLDIAVRAGLVAYGVVHLLIGWLALQLAFGDSAGTADSQGAMHQLAETPIGRPLLWLLALGFLALVVWQLAEAAIGHEDKDGAGRAAKRVASAGKAVLFGVLGFSSAKIAAGSGSSGGGGSTEETWTAELMSAPAGQWLVALVGLGIIAVGLYEVHRGWTESFRKQLEAGATGGNVGSAIVLAGKIGYIAKGSALSILGGLVVAAGVTHDSQKSGGLDDALKELLDQPYGQPVLVIIGLGIATFGVYCFARARHLKR